MHICIWPISRWQGTGCHVHGTQMSCPWCRLRMILLYFFYAIRNLKLVSDLIGWVRKIHFKYLRTLIGCSFVPFCAKTVFFLNRLTFLFAYKLIEMTILQARRSLHGFVRLVRSMRDLRLNGAQLTCGKSFESKQFLFLKL